jgi:hypothetical protein
MSHSRCTFAVHNEALVMGIIDSKPLPKLLQSPHTFRSDTAMYWDFPHIWWTQISSEVQGLMEYFEYLKDWWWSYPEVKATHGSRIGITAPYAGVRIGEDLTDIELFGDFVGFKIGLDRNIRLPYNTTGISQCDTLPSVPPIPTQPHSLLRDRRLLDESLRQRISHSLMRPEWILPKWSS